jgi:F0F1-type ATP synthase assembly protein I
VRITTCAKEKLCAWHTVLSPLQPFSLHEPIIFPSWGKQVEPEEEKQEAPEAVKKKEEKKLWFEQVDYKKVTVLTGIPMTMLAGVLVGYGIGYFVEKRFPSNNLLLALFILLGCAAGFKLVADYIKRFM